MQVSPPTPPKLGYSISPDVVNTKQPPIPLALEWAAKFKPTSDRPLLDLSHGVPGIPPPKFLLDAIAEAGNDEKNCAYGSIKGEPVLRQAMAKETKFVYGSEADVREEDVLITAGCNMAFVSAAITLASSRPSEIILPTPWYFNNQMILQSLGIKMIQLPVSPEEGFLPSPERCEKLITSLTRAIVVVTPNNPTGATCSPHLLVQFAKLARKHKIALIVDETYRDFITSGPPHKLFYSRLEGDEADWNWRSHLISLFSFSKSYCVPGHRLGMILAHPDFIEQALKVTDCLQICPPRPIQIALQQHLPALRPFVKQEAKALEDRHTLFKNVIPKGWNVGAAGGYFAFLRHPFKEVTVVEVCKRLAEEYGVVFLPASFFAPSEGAKNESDSTLEIYQKNWMRVSIGNVGDDAIRQLGKRLEEFTAHTEWEQIVDS